MRKSIVLLLIPAAIALASNPLLAQVSASPDDTIAAANERPHTAGAGHSGLTYDEERARDNERVKAAIAQSRANAEALEARRNGGANRGWIRLIAKLLMYGLIGGGAGLYAYMKKRKKDKEAQDGQQGV